MSFVDALTSQQQLNEHMRAKFAIGFAKWGIKVHRIELLDMMPKGDTSRYMRKQMIAERERRAHFITAEGQKAAMRLAADGAKLVKFNLGVAEQESTRKRSEGDAAAKVMMARAEKAAFDVLADTLESDGCAQSEYLLTQQFTELMTDMARVVDNKTVYLPFEISSITGIVKGLDGVFGRNAPRPKLPAAPAAAGAGSGASDPPSSSDPFAELN